MGIIGFLVFLLIACLALLAVMRHKAENPEMSTDQIEFDTKKTLQQIISELRSFKCSVEKLKDDPLEDYGDGPKPSIAVLLAGKATISDAFNHFGAGKSEWGVQVVVYDLGNKRHVSLTALGESALGQSFRAYAASGGDYWKSVSLSNQYFNIKHSIDYRDRIAKMLA